MQRCRIRKAQRQSESCFGSQRSRRLAADLDCASLTIGSFGVISIYSIDLQVDQAWLEDTEENQERPLEDDWDLELNLDEEDAEFDEAERQEKAKKAEERKRKREEEQQSQGGVEESVHQGAQVDESCELFGVLRRIEWTGSGLTVCIQAKLTSTPWATYPCMRTCAQFLLLFESLFSNMQVH